MDFFTGGPEGRDIQSMTVFFEQARHYGARATATAPVEAPNTNLINRAASDTNNKKLMVEQLENDVRDAGQNLEKLHT